MEAEEEKAYCDVCYCIWCTKTLKQQTVTTILLVICPILMYMQRVCLGLAIVNMTNWTVPQHDDTTCVDNFNAASKYYVILEDSQYEWDETVQSYILLSFFAGYMMGSLFVGVSLDECGSRPNLLLGLTTSSILTALIPPIVYHTNWGWLCALRFVSGAGQSVLYSCASAMVARWHSEETKSSVFTMILLSFTFGIILGNLGTGFIMFWTKTWCWVFYIIGALGIVWSVVFFFYVYSSPDDHPHMTNEEALILARIPQPGSAGVPVCEMLSDLPVWILCVAHFASDFTVYLIIINMPKYFVFVLGFSSPITGMILTVPSAAAAVGGMAMGHLGDFLITRNIMRKLSFRLICSAVGLVVPPLFMLIMVLMKCNGILASAMVTVAMFFQSWYYAGAGMMAIDMSLNYSGALYGCCNIAGGLAGSISPYLVGAIAYENKFPQWEIIAYIIIAISTVAFVLVVLFSKVERRYWDFSGEEEKPPEDDAPMCAKIWSWHQPKIIDG